MKDIFNEEDINKVVEVFTKKTIDKLKEDLLDDIYKAISEYLYEHYRNNKDKIEEELINSICEEYVKNPLEYKYSKLREKIFNEHKEELSKVLTNEGIEKSVEDVMMKYTTRNYHFSWKWKDEIVRFILEHWNDFKNDERINQGLLREIENKKVYINSLKERLNDISNLAD